MWPFKPKPKAQTLSDKQLEILNYIDTTLVKLHANKPIIGSMKIKMVGVPYMSTILPINQILHRIGLEADDAYLPRSVAFVIDENGNWTYFYAVRSLIGSDDITNRLFVEALTKTNNQR